MCQHGDLVWMPQLGPYGRFIDACMKPFVEKLLEMNFITLACCCGHGKYPKTIVVQGLAGAWEYRSGKQIDRSRRFYKRDVEGLYFIPEIAEEAKP